MCVHFRAKGKTRYSSGKAVERHLTGNDKFSISFGIWPGVSSKLLRINYTKYYAISHSSVAPKKVNRFTLLSSAQKKKLIYRIQQFLSIPFFSLHFLYFFQLNCCCISAKSNQPRLKCWCTWWKKLWMNRSVLNIIIKKLFYSWVTRNLLARGCALLILLKLILEDIHPNDLDVFNRKILINTCSILCI